MDFVMERLSWGQPRPSSRGFRQFCCICALGHKREQLPHLSSPGCKPPRTPAPGAWGCLDRAGGLGAAPRNVPAPKISGLSKATGNEDAFGCMVWPHVSVPECPQVSAGT